MRWLGILGQWRPAAAGCVLVCLATACGGGDGNTGPGGGGGQQLAGTYQLIGADNEQIPTVVTNPVCSPAQILSGSLQLSGNGQYEMQFNYRNEDGDDWAGDHGTYQMDDGNLLFSSEAWGDQFEGSVEGRQVWLTWDFCADGQGPELELTFSR
jgi:hypothetical protein